MFPKENAGPRIWEFLSKIETDVASPGNFPNMTTIIHIEEKGIKEALKRF